MGIVNLKLLNFDPVDAIYGNREIIGIQLANLGIMQFVTLFSEYYKFVYIANPRWY